MRTRYEVLEAVGFGLIAARAWLFSLPAGLIVTGAAAVVLAWSWEGNE